MGLGQSQHGAPTVPSSLTCAAHCSRNSARSDFMRRVLLWFFPITPLEVGARRLPRGDGPASLSPLVCDTTLSWRPAAVPLGPVSRGGGCTVRIRRNPGARCAAGASETVSIFTLRADI
ncbi:hypothetical protein PSCLAVI8L_130405 [Pseudoclavibacter sp. 8L]|nr:hypothetical protein PSCLAVI8L_130405 [Pseudoclavibacter sp. 8L]